MERGPVWRWQLDRISRDDSLSIKSYLTPSALRAIIERAEAVFKAESTLLQLTLPDSVATVTVVGDTHGQLHDVIKMLAVAGSPGGSSYFVFNGDFVDRGAWGLETLVLLLAWKLALPQRVFLLRGNHESASCTLMYGFKGELKAKLGRGAWSDVYARCKRLFAALPLAAVVQHNTLVVHGGLFRKPSRLSSRQASKRKRAGSAAQQGRDETEAGPAVGSLSDLAAASKGGADPSDAGSSRLAADVLWSDPVPTPGLEFNAARGVGITFGPDVTEAFLRDNGLRLVLRSHEGPDAREDRLDMPPLNEGWSLDHDTPCGKLMTVFSAPQYPQFVADEALRCHNKGAVAVLSAPDYATPRMVTYEADLPRPAAQPFYALDAPGSDEEFEPAASSVSCMGDVSGTCTAGIACQEAAAVAAIHDDAASGGGAGSQQAQRAEQRQQDRTEGEEAGEEAGGREAVAVECGGGPSQKEASEERGKTNALVMEPRQRGRRARQGHQQPKGTARAAACPAPEGVSVQV